MALQGSGIITMEDLQDEYGGVNPINLNEYYRNGSYVPNSINEYYNQQYDIYDAANQTYWYTDSATNTSGMYYNGTNWYSGGSFGNTGLTSGSTTYNRKTYQGSFAQFDYYSYDRYDTIAVSVNQNVPTSGTIRLSDFTMGERHNGNV